MKSYVDSLPPSFVEKYESKSVPWGELGYVTYKRTYARQLASGGTEEWHQTVKRCVNSVLNIGKFTSEEAMFLYDSVFNLKCSFSGRGLWQLGTPTMSRFGGDSLMNCWCLSINDPVKPFCFAFNELMLGGGVGFNLQKENVYEMPPVKYSVAIVRRDEKDVDYIVPDNREGWIELLRRTLEAFFVTGKSFSFSTICIRPKGARIKGFGGVASGPEDLCQGIEQIAGVLSSRHGKKLRPIDCLDVMNIIGSIVVSGNVRRSAQLALGDPDDYQFLSAKDWSKHKLPPWRNMSNNSVACNSYEHLTDSFWKGYGGEGESYGMINLKNCRTYGRLIDGTDYRPDSKVVGTNPCGEVPLENGESCNLCEIFLPRMVDASEFIKVSEIMYKVVKSISCLPMIYPETNEIVKRNHRLGISVTGFLQSKYIKDHQMFTDSYKNIEKVDVEYSRVLGVNKSIKLTTVKPSGTVSLLPGVTPGVHPSFSPYYIRRIRMASNDLLVDQCIRHGYKAEPLMQLDGSRDMNTMVVEFPVKSPAGTLCAKDVSAVQQLEYQKFLQTYWSDNSVSVTVYYKPEELPQIKEWLSKNYNHGVKAVSFLLHTGHGFKQAPYEEITEAQYKEIVGKVKPITKIDDKEAMSFKESLECATGACPIK
jgi:ribonucleoside-triphosphate reductase